MLAIIPILYIAQFFTLRPNTSTLILGSILLQGEYKQFSDVEVHSDYWNFLNKCVISTWYNDEQQMVSPDGQIKAIQMMGGGFTSFSQMVGAPRVRTLAAASVDACTADFPGHAYVAQLTC